MAIKASEISDLIKARIEKFASATEERNVGAVVTVTDGIVRIHGLADAKYGEMLEFPGGSFGLALNLERDSVGAVVLGEYKHIVEGDTVKTTGRILEVPVGEGLLGRVVDSLGKPIDGKGPIKATGKAPIERVAPGVVFRKSVSQPVQTGYKAVDSMVPIGRGQRELIIGDRQTGKTALAIDTIINQKNQRHQMHLCRRRSEAKLDRERRTQARRARRAEAHDHRGRLRLDAGLDAVSRAVRRVRDGRVLHGSGRRRADHLRRSDQAGLGVPPDLAAAAPSAGPRSVSGRRVLSALAFARAFRARQRGIRREEDRTAA